MTQAAEGLNSTETVNWPLIQDIEQISEQAKLNTEAAEINNGRADTPRYYKLVWINRKICFLSVQWHDLHRPCVFIEAFQFDLLFCKVRGSTMLSVMDWFLPTFPEWLILDANPLDSFLQGEFLIHFVFSVVDYWVTVRLKVMLHWHVLMVAM